MSANIEAKKQVVEEIKAKITASKSIVLADYNKLTVMEVTALRNKFKEVNCEYKVYKNTLVRKAFNELGITDFDNDLNGTTATVFCADETSGAAVFAKETKANPALVEKIVPKCAFVENKYLDKAGVKELSLNAVFLEVRESNACAIGLYKKFAFNEIAVRKKYYPDGENAVVMKKEI